MIVADLRDFAVCDLHNCRADRLNFAALRVGAVERQFGDTAPAVASAWLKFATAVRIRGEFAFVRTPDLCATRAPLAGRANKDWRVMKAGHHSFEVVAVKRVEGTTLDQLFLGCHIPFPFPLVIGGVTITRISEY
jgi:hypothetical protein